MASKKTFPDYTSGDESPAAQLAEDGALTGALSPEVQLRRRMERQADIRFKTQGGIEEKPAKNEDKPYKLR